MLAVGSILGDAYTLARLIGSGSMGTVYEATSASGERVALKALASSKRKTDGAERRARFLREAAVCASLRDPNIVPVIDHGIDAATDTPYFVMPLLEGEDMKELLEREGPLDPDVAVALFAQACDGLAAAHAAGVVHRDIKPSNLFLVRGEGGDVKVKIADFGLAKVDDPVESLTTSGKFMGSPHYVSPEQAINAKNADARSDVWGLAMSLYHALAGAPAFAYVRSFMGLVLELTARDAPHVQDAAPWVEAPLARVLHAALLRAPELRCPSAGELALGLEMAVGIDRARASVAPDAVKRVSSERRATVAPRAALPESWDDVLRL